jgi:curved DNA-binding protein CbpA
MKRDLYAELDVPPTADEREIRRGYRRRAKAAHPDKGGSHKEFQAICQALAVLTDPKRRAAYDATGEIEEPPADNKRATALQIIEQAIAGAANEYVDGGFNPRLDPRKRDMVAEARAKIQGEVHEAHRNLDAGARVIAFLKDFSTRFETTERENFFARSMQSQIDRHTKQLGEIRAAIEVRELALEILTRYRFIPGALGNITS